MHVLALFSVCMQNIKHHFDIRVVYVAAPVLKKGRFAQLCSHLDRISSRSATKVERAKAKMHRNGSAFALHRCTLNFEVLLVWHFRNKTNMFKVSGSNFSFQACPVNCFCFSDHEKFERRLHPDRCYKNQHVVSKVERAKAKMHRNSSPTTCPRRLRVFWIVHIVCQNIPCILLQIFWLV